MRWVLTTPLGMPVDPEVNSTFATVSGPTLACAASTAAVGVAGGQIGERRDLALRRRIARDDYLQVGRHDRFDGALEGAAVGGEHEPRRQQVEHVAQLAEVLRDQRIGRRDRHIRHADVEGGEPQQRMLDVVAGEDGDRPLRGNMAPQQRLADAPRLVERPGISDAAPAAPLVALHEQHPVRRPRRPVFQPLGEFHRIGAQRMRRPQMDDATRAPLDHNIGGTKPHRPEPRRRLTQVAHRIGHASPWSLDLGLVPNSSRTL